MNAVLMRTNYRANPRIVRHGKKNFWCSGTGSKGFTAARATSLRARSRAGLTRKTGSKTGQNRVDQ